MKKLKIKEFITEDNNRIANEILFEVLDHKQKSLLVSPMKTGKTTFMFEYLLNQLNEANIQLIVVTPCLSLIDNIQSKYKNNSIKCNGDIRSITLKPGCAVTTTAESMYKVIDACKEAKKSYFIVYDEVHKIITDHHREKLRLPLFEYYENELCIGFLGMTATPDPLRNVEFEKKFYIEVENKFIQADETVIVKNFVNNPDNILNFLKFVQKKYKNRVIISRIINKNNIKLVKKGLEKDNNKVIAWYRDNEINDASYKEDMEDLKKVLEGSTIENTDFLLCTSLIDVGVEIQLDEKPIVIDFTNTNSTIVDDIQFIGRFRQGVEAFYLVGKLQTDNGSIMPPINRKRLYEEELKNTINAVNYLNKHAKNNKGDNLPSFADGIKSTLENDTWYFEVDEIDLQHWVFKEYVKIYLQKAHLLERFLNKHLTFNTEKVTIIDYETLEIKETKELSEQKKLDKKELEQIEKEFYEKIKKVHEVEQDDNLIEMILNGYIAASLDQWKLQNYLPLTSLWKSNSLEDFRQRYAELKYILSNKPKFDNMMLLDIAQTSKATNALKKQIAYIDYNISFEGNNKIINIRNKDKLLVFEIRNYILKIKGKERGVYLSDKFKAELLEHLKKKKSLSKTTANSLDKLLNMIYILSNNKNMKRISSINLNL